MQYAILVLENEQQRLSTDMQLQGPAPGTILDPRPRYLEQLDKAISVLRECQEKKRK